MAGLLESLFSGGASALGATQQIGANTALGDYAVDESRKIGTDAMANSTFQPFSVASQTGNSQVGADGSVDAQLSGQYQGLSNQFLGNAGQFAGMAGDGITDFGQQRAYNAAAGLFGQAAQDPAERQAQLFADYQAAMQPGQDRQDQRLQAQLNAQGRSGITSNLYGGSGEQFANAMAREEAGLNAFNQAQQMGLAEQAQQGALANSFQNTGYAGSQLGMQNQAQNAALANQYLQGGMLPGQQLFNELNSGFTGADLAQTGQLTGVGYDAQARTTGLEGKINAEKLNSDLYASLYGAGSNVAGAAGSALDSTDFGEWLNGFF